MQDHQIKNIVEATLLASGRPLSLQEIASVFGSQTPETSQLREVLGRLQEEYQGRGIMIAEVASGYRVQVRATMTPWVSRLWEERTPRYSRALLETLALIAYRQPITRGDIEEIRGVSVSTNIIRTLSERGWIRVVGHRDVPGRPAMYGTTREFLDYFGLRRLEELPPLSELQDLDQYTGELDLASNASGDPQAEPPAQEDSREEDAKAGLPLMPSEGQAEEQGAELEDRGTREEEGEENPSASGAQVVPLRRPDPQ